MALKHKPTAPYHSVQDALRVLDTVVRHTTGITDTVCAAVPITAGCSVGCPALSLPVEHAHRLRHAADALDRNAAPVLLSPAI